MTVTDIHRQLIALFPRYLSSRRVGWQGLHSLLDVSGLPRPALFFLIDFCQEADPGLALSRADLENHLFSPYATFSPFFESLPALVEKSYLAVTDAGAYQVTPSGRELVEQVEQGVRAYLATLRPLPLPELDHLATTLEELAAREWQAREPPIKAHQARIRRLPPVEPNAPPMVRLEVAVYALWMARDDAHIASWRAAGFSGPRLDLLSALATGESRTLSTLTASFERTQRPPDVARGIAELARSGYARLDGDRVEITEAGRQIRAHIEAETDRLYFSPWPPLAAADLKHLSTTLERVCLALEAMRSKP